MDWIGQTAGWLRELLAQLPWLDAWKPLIARTPDWALLAAPPTFLGLSTLMLRAIWPSPKSPMTEKKTPSPFAPTPPYQVDAWAPRRAPTAKPTPSSTPRSEPSAQSMRPSLHPESAPPPSEADYSDNRSVRVFVSSTFLDMQIERKVLVTDTFPALRAKYRARGVEVFEVDLRWGITKEQQERGEALPTLLAEIDRCRPYFVGLLGDRYGWIPPPVALTDKLKADYPAVAGAQGASVTELEIIHGVLSNPATAERAVFFERDAGWDWIATLEPADRAAAEAETDAERARLEELKSQIRQKARIEAYVRPNDVVQKVFGALDALLEAQFPEAEAPDAFELTARLHRAYARERRGLHVGAEGSLRDLNRWMETKEAVPMLITGASGGGKSTLVANWLHARRNTHPESRAFVFEHYLGASPDSADPMLLLRRLWEHLNRATGETVELPAGYTDLMDVSAGLAQRLAQARLTADHSGARLLIALDGLDKLSSEQNLRWLPMVPGVHLLASSLDGEAKIAALASGFAPLEVKPLTEHQRQEFIAGTLARWRRQLEPQHIVRILQPGVPELAGSPLYLKTVLEELRVSADHTHLAQRLEDYRSARHLPDLFDRVLKRLEDGCEPGLVARTLPLIWASRAGLEEAEIIAITNAAPLDWATLRNGLGDNLRDQAGRLVFSHDYLQSAVKKRYLPGASLRAAHQQLAKHFEMNAEPRRKFEEWPWQLLRAGETAAFVVAISDVDNVASMLEHNASDLESYWIEGDRLGEDIETVFGKRWKAHHADVAAALAQQRTAYFNPRVLIIPQLCEFFVRAGRLGPVVGDIAYDFFDMLRFADSLDEIRPHLGTALELLSQTGRGREALEAIRTLDDKYGTGWRGSDGQAAKFLSVEARLLAGRGDIPEAIELSERALRIKREVYSPDDETALIETNNLAALYRRVGRLGDGEALHRDTYERRKRLLGSDAVDTLISGSNLAANLDAQGKYEEALAIAIPILNVKSDKLGRAHQSTLTTMLAVAQCHYHAGADDAAKSLSEEVFDTLRKRGRTHVPLFLETAMLLSDLIRRTQDEKAEIAHCVEVTRSLSEGSAPPLDDLHEFCARLDSSLIRNGSLEQAHEAYRLLYDCFRRWGDTQNYSYGLVCGRLASTEYDSGEYEKAAKHYGASVSTLTAYVEKASVTSKERNTINLQIVDFTAKAAQSEMNLGASREAFDRAVCGFQFCKGNSFKPPDDRLETVLSQAATALINSAKKSEEAGKVAQSAELLEAVADGVARSLGLTHRNHIAALSSWGGLLTRANQLEEALYVCEKAFACALRAQPQNEDLLRSLAANRLHVREKLDAAHQGHN